MSRTLVRLFAALALCFAWGPSPAVADGLPPMMLGPGDANVSNIKDQALIRVSQYGYRYIAGQQDSHLTITLVNGRLLYRDTGTKRLGSIPSTCDRRPARVGIKALCKIPARFQQGRMFLEVWPRLGNDYIDARTLPAKFRLWALVDAGRDVVFGGAGDDFVNGAKDADRVRGGAGNDFLRTGPGNDKLWGGTGRDRLSCAENFDTAYRLGADSFYQCEVIRQG